MELEQKKALTSIERGKMMKLYWTQTNGIVAACGHKLSEHAEPKNNCTDCWVAFFTNHGELTKTANECYKNEGKDVLIALKGVKFTKMFGRYMNTIDNFIKQGDNEQSVR